MSEMKISDVFNLPVRTVAMSICVDQVNENYNDGVTPWDCIDDAINNHDKLTETVKQQQETIDELVCMLKGLTEEYDELIDKSINYIGSHSASGLAQAKLLLSKLNNEVCDE